MIKNYSLFILFIFGFAYFSYGQIYQQSFEGALNSGYTSSGVFSDGTNDYFDLIGTTCLL